MTDIDYFEEPTSNVLVNTFLDDSDFSACLFAASDMPVIVEFNESVLHPNKTREKFDQLSEKFGRKVAFVRLNMEECNVSRMYKLRYEDMPLYQIFLDRRPIEGERCKDDPRDVEILVRRWLQGGAGRVLHVDSVHSFIGQMRSKREDKRFIEDRKRQKAIEESKEK